MLFIGVFIYHKVFIYIFLIMSVLGCVFAAVMIFCRQSKTEAQLKIESLRQKMFGKDKKDAELGIEMTEMHLHGNDKDKNHRATESQRNAKK